MEVRDRTDEPAEFWLVMAYPTFFLESRVSAHPSTAISWVAARRTRIKNSAVTAEMRASSRRPSAQRALKISKPADASWRGTIWQGQK